MVLWLVLGAGIARAQFTPVDLSSSVNRAWTDITNGAVYPIGSQSYAGVPFSIADAGGLNIWVSNFDEDFSLTLPLNIAAATRVYTLLNTGWGQLQDSATLTFTGSAGATYSVTFAGGVDLRDHAQGVWTNTYTANTTDTVFDSVTGTPVRLDRQTIVLPADFAAQTLTSITITDLIHVFGVSGLLLSAVTVQAVPEPGTWGIAAGLCAVVWAMWRRGRVRPAD